MVQDLKDLEADDDKFQDKLAAILSGNYDN